MWLIPLLDTHTLRDMHTHKTHKVLCYLLIVIFSLKRPVGCTWRPQCGLMWTRHGCWALWLILVCPFRSLAHAHPSVPFALLSLTLAPSSGLSLSYFLRPPHLTTPLDPTPPHPHQRFLAGRFVFICNFAFGFSLCCFFASCVLLPSCALMSVKTSQSPFCCCSSSSVFQSFLTKMS